MPRSGVEIRDLETAQHEAAHVVVGVVLGLRFRRATITGNDPKWCGETDFAFVRGDDTANAIMTAAGIAWDRGLRFPRVSYAEDLRWVRKIVGSGRRSVEACVTAAAAILAGRMAVHARVTRALLEGDITGADLERLMG